MSEADISDVGVATDWLIYRGTGEPHDDLRSKLPPPPRWREFNGEPLVNPKLGAESVTARRLGELARGAAYQASAPEVEMVNAALYLRRPLLVTGKPGTGKSTLAHSVARELNLGPVLYWPITSRSDRNEGLYAYDAIARLQDASLHSLAGPRWRPGRSGPGHWRLHQARPAGYRAAAVQVVTGAAHR